MISSKKEMYNYIECDLKAQQAYPITARMRLTSLFYPCIWKFQIKLRKMEYLHNCRRRNIFEKLIFLIRYMRFQNYGMKLGFSIPLNVFGPGLCLCHAGTIIVNQHCRIGANARIHAGVNIGNSSKFDENWSPSNTPIIGDNVYIGPGAKIYGKISIGNDVAIGANAVVNKNVPDHVTMAGVPAKIINENGSEGLVIYGYPISQLKIQQ